MAAASPAVGLRPAGLTRPTTFTGTLWRVELEKELALKSQRLDAVIIARRDPPPPDATAFDLPDGLEGLRAHNVLTYKSHHEPLDA
ncbi:hypothetical protein [Thiococcus pfennigii]|uniref:hypothetical protein n=1 Tax=Thiococcus pfennigii TaxID=1057 RepID=UPI001F5B6D78|nr:hypothetical protein [Thiococcus pfennigii]